MRAGSGPAECAPQSCALSTDIVYKAFKMRFIKKVKQQLGKWVPIEVCQHQDSAGLDHALDVSVQHRSTSTLTMCVAGSLGSAVAHAGDTSAANSIVAQARASVASMDALKSIKAVVNSSLALGWFVQPLPREPLKSHYPCLLHVEGRDSAGRLDRSHAITVMAGMIFDANHSNALAVSAQNLDACIPGEDFKFHRVIRGFQAIPSKKARHAPQLEPS
jgi:hypothetical protein